MIFVVIVQKTSKTAVFVLHNRRVTYVVIKEREYYTAVIVMCFTS